MGGSQSATNNVAPGPRKKIVIIGASFGGKIMTNMLQQIDQEEKLYEILLVDKNEHFEYICTNFEMLANPASFGDNSIKFEDAIKSYDSSRVTFM
jgi:NADH dehydrogenase FAD-containing subunit